ncbi:SRPBCC family protein [Amycolatopsis cihanbeyliensis]|uniref:Polyketide cyclase/dehydrase/lipid transport protein n=1 Tax=Amycolatopsis cihanbeyliensis TaxID=1128664 RepID=A0A542DQ15_AMYCI|nr:SRPBCC family protein [Amycolatopsis cihanbeyliensis]TQJ05157.1 polyketide cyclase/dehydrase/lipid transport protein [Amycolatopsis cihanbeyliensis]
MAKTSVENAPLFRLSAEIHVAAPPAEVYAVVGDLARSGEWSPECVGGSWVSGEPGTVGAVFRGENLRGTDVVAWAPVVRGTWFTESEVVAAEPGRTFQWSMRTHSGEKQDSVWAYDIEARDGGSVLTHRFRMGSPTEGIRGITAEMDEAGKSAFFAEWGEKLAADLAVTLERIKHVIENRSTEEKG